MKVIKFARILKAERKKRKLSQGKLAKLVGVSRRTVNLWKTEQRDPHLLFLVQLADALNVSLDDIVFGEE